MARPIPTPRSSPLPTFPRLRADSRDESSHGAARGGDHDRPPPARPLMDVPAETHHRPQRQTDEHSEPDENAPDACLVPRAHPSDAQGESGQRTEWRSADKASQIPAET